MTNTNPSSKTTIIWVDSDPNISRSADLFRNQNWTVVCFNETADALIALQKRELPLDNIKCVLTSMMERGGRRQRGLLNGLEMINEIKRIWKENSLEKYPLFAINSMTANVKQCLQDGVDICVHGNRDDVQCQVIARLNRTSRVILIGIGGPSGCGKTAYAKHLAKYLSSPIAPISLDWFITDPIYINHPVLGRIKTLEQPDTIDVVKFHRSLVEINRDWTSSQFRLPNVNANSEKIIFVIVEGFLLFALSNDVTSMFHIRIFLDSTQSRCRMQRFRRQTKVDPKVPDSQVNISERFSTWYDNLVWIEYLKRRHLQISSAHQIFKPESYENMNYTILDAYILERISELVDNS